MCLYCNDDSVDGTPFFIMDFVPGRVFGDSAWEDLAPDELGEAYHALIDTLAALHSVDYRPWTG